MGCIMVMNRAIGISATLGKWWLVTHRDVKRCYYGISNGEIVVQNCESLIIMDTLW
jgi:hypothetical protein